MKENKLLQRGRYFNTDTIFKEFNPDWNKYDFVKMFGTRTDTLFGLKSDGSLWLLGQNCIGLGECANLTSDGYELYITKEFTKIEGVTNVKKADYSGSTMMIVTNDGELYCAGLNSSGQLGLGDNTSRSQLEKNSMANVEDVSVASSHSIILLKDGTVYTTGYNANGQLGLNDDTNRNSFTLTDITDVKSVFAYNTNTMVLKNDGTVYGTGYNSYGELGLGHTTKVNTFTKIPIDNVKELLGGWYYSIVLKNDNTLWGAGNNEYGQFGVGDRLNKTTFVAMATNVKQVSCGVSFTVIHKLDGTVWGTGFNNGQFGIESSNPVISFTEIKDLIDIKNVTCTAYSIYATTNNSEILFAGKGRPNVIGYKDNINGYTTINRSYSKYKNNDYIGYSKMINVGKDSYLLNDNGDFLFFNKNDKIVCGANCTFILRKDGVLLCTGANTFGKLGINSIVAKVDTFRETTMNNVKDVICASDHTIVIRYDGTVWGCGRNGENQLGIADRNDKLRFHKLPIDNVRKIECGINFTIVLKNDGTVWGTGINSAGQLGLGHTSSPIMSFTKLPIDNVKDITCGASHTIITKNDGTIWGTGASSSGQLGLGTGTRTSFVRIPIDDIKQVVTYSNHTLILKNDSSLWGTGANENGQLGLSHTTSPITSFTEITNNVEYVYRGAVGASHTIIRKFDGIAYGAGVNSSNQISSSSSSYLSSFTAMYNSSTNLSFMIRDASYGTTHTILTLTSGVTLAIGKNSSGQLGLGTTTELTSLSNVQPTIPVHNILSQFNNNFKIVATRNNRTFFLRDDDTLWGVGNNTNGELGNSNLSNGIARAVKLNINDVKDVVTGEKTSIVLKTDGTLWGTGDNSTNNSLGEGMSKHNVFVKLSTFINNSNIVQVSMGNQFTLALTDIGTVYGTGDNRYGQLGLGSTISTSKFTKIPIDNVRFIATGSDSSYIIKNDNTLWTTGDNRYGQLGLGNSSNFSTFTKVEIDNVKEVIVGEIYALVLKYDGTLWATGRNNYAQLGLGDKTDRNTFTKVNIDNIKKVSCGALSTFVLKNDDTAWSVGYNINGELGLGDATPREEFTQITRFPKIKDIYAGYYYTMVLLHDGTIWGVGKNTNGQQGNGSVTSSLEFKKAFNYDNGDDFKYNLIKFDKINSIVINNNFNLINNEYLIPVKDVLYSETSAIVDEYELDYEKLLGKNIVSVHPRWYDKIRIPMENIKEFWMSKTHTLVVNTDGELYGCGSNLYGQLLNPIETTELTSFTKLNLDNVKQASCGTGFSYFVKNDGTLYSVGLNDTYQLGLGHNNEVTEPQIVNISNVKKVMCDHNFTLVLKNDNTLWVQGYNRNGNLGLGTNKANQTIIEFTKVAEDIDDVEIGSDYILLRKTDNTVYISGKIREHYNIVGNDTTIFNKIGIPDFVKTEDLTWVNPMNDDTTVMIYKTHTMNSTIEVMEKTISGFKIKIDDIGNPIIKVEMYINNELITTMSEFTNKVAAFSIPLDKIKLGVNNVVFKGYDDDANNMYASAIINKENNAMCVTENSNLLINEKRYTVKSIIDTENKITVTLDRELEEDINVGDIIYQLINKLKVQIKTNNSGMHKDAKLLEMKKVDTGYQEIYEFAENGMKEVEPKIIVDGNENTVLKRPSILFSIDEETL
ncbi:RCC1-like domain-containing protein [Clostridioides difficile]